MILLCRTIQRDIPSRLKMAINTRECKDVITSTFIKKTFCPSGILSMRENSKQNIQWYSGSSEQVLKELEGKAR